MPPFILVTLNPLLVTAFHQRVEFCGCLLPALSACDASSLKRQMPAHVPRGRLHYALLRRLPVTVKAVHFANLNPNDPVCPVRNR